MHVASYFLSRTHTHVTRPLRYRANIAYSTATYMHSQFLRFAIGRGQGWLEKSRCVTRLAVERYALKTGARCYTQRERHLSATSFAQILLRARDTTRYREYYFPRIFFVINTNCRQRAGGLAKDLRQSGIAKKKAAALPPSLSSKQSQYLFFLFRRVHAVFGLEIMSRDSAPRKSVPTS